MSHISKLFVSGCRFSVHDSCIRSHVANLSDNSGVLYWSKVLMIAIMDWEETCIFNVKIWYSFYKTKGVHSYIFKLLCFYTDIINCYVYFCFGFSLLFVVRIWSCILSFTHNPVNAWHQAKYGWLSEKLLMRRGGKGQNISSQNVAKHDESNLSIAL